MFTLLFWLYILNATLIIAHEIESAYWREWEMMRLPGESVGFVIVHIPLIFLIFVGASQLYAVSLSGLAISFLLSIGGIAAYFIHKALYRKDATRFNGKLSWLLLGLILVISVFQLVWTVFAFIVGVV